MYWELQNLDTCRVMCQKKELHVWIIQLRLGKVSERKAEIAFLLQIQKYSVQYLAHFVEFILLTNTQWLV